jgi:hypothetical protein
VYGRELEGTTLTLRPSGWTYDTVFVLYDQESGTLWYPRDGGLQGIQGKHFKRKLPGLEFDDTTWGQWQTLHPESSLVR